MASTIYQLFAALITTLLVTVQPALAAYGPCPGYTQDNSAFGLFLAGGLLGISLLAGSSALKRSRRSRWRVYRLYWLLVAYALPLLAVIPAAVSYVRFSISCT